MNTEIMGYISFGHFQHDLKVTISTIHENIQFFQWYRAKKQVFYSTRWGCWCNVSENFPCFEKVCQCIVHTGVIIANLLVWEDKIIFYWEMSAEFYCVRRPLFRIYYILLNLNSNPNVKNTRFAVKISQIK